MIPIIQTLISSHIKDKSWKLNFDFLEANVINICLLVIGLVYVLRQFLGDVLTDRQEKVLIAIQEAEDQLAQAKKRLTESEKQLTQSQMVIKQIQQEAKVTAQKVRQSILKQGQLDIQRLSNAGKASIITAENQIRKQIQQQITTLAVKRVFVQLKKQMNPETQLSLINKGIARLGEQL